VFWLVIANQGIYKTLKHPIDNPSFKVLYQPLRKDQRLSTQITVETLVTPLTIGLAGGLMLLFSRAVTYDPVVFAWMMLAVFGGWEIMAKGAGQEYARALVAALKRRIVDDDDPFTYDDPRSVAILRKTLARGEPGDVLFALDLLDKANAPGLERDLVRLTAHRDPDVRREALVRLERRDAHAALKRVAPRATKDAVTAVRAVALRAGVVAGADGVAAKALASLDDPSPEVRKGALVGLMRSGHDEARTRLAAVARSPAPADRAWAARVLGEVGEVAAPTATVVGPLGSLLNDSSTTVRRAAFAAAGRARARPLWASVLEGLGDRRLRSAAVSALSLGGDEVVDVLAACLDGTASSAVARDAARVLGRIGGARAQAALRAHLHYPDQLVRIEVLEGLRRCGYAAEPGSEEAAGVRRQLEEELDDAGWTLAVLRDLPPAPELAMLSSALARELGRTRQAVLLLLSFLHDPTAILRAREGLAHESKEKRAYALEVLDVTVDRDLKPRVLAFMEDHEAAVTSTLLGDALARETKTAHERVREVALRPRAFVSGWTTACAAQAASRLGGEGWGDVLAAAADDRSPLVRETAAFARARLDGLDYTGGGGRMLTIERVIALKAVPMFEQVSEEILADVAELMEEVEYKAGEVVFEKGAKGDSLYIVVSGRMRIYDGERTIVLLGEKEMFGELALLDPEPRLASVAAAEDSRLFRLDRESFSELMAGNIEVVRGVLHVLCERLRRQGSYAPDRAGVDTAGR
jgi:CRP-like cAMP-binding protein